MEMVPLCLPNPARNTSFTDDINSHIVSGSGIVMGAGADAKEQLSLNISCR